MEVSPRPQRGQGDASREVDRRRDPRGGYTGGGVAGISDGRESLATDAGAAEGGGGDGGGTDGR